MPALVIIDTQELFPACKGIVEGIAEEAAKEFYDEIAIITFSNTDGSNFETELGFRGGGRYDPRIAVYPEIKDTVHLGKRVFLGQHTGYSWSNSLHALLSEEVYLCGCETHSAIYGTALNLFEEKKVRIIKDLCISEKWMLHLNALYALGTMLGAQNILMSSDIPTVLEKGEDADGISTEE